MAGNGAAHQTLNVLVIAVVVSSAVTITVTVLRPDANPVSPDITKVAFRSVVVGTTTTEVVPRATVNVAPESLATPSIVKVAVASLEACVVTSATVIEKVSESERIESETSKVIE